MGDNTFVLAGDGWVQVTPCGEFPHAGAGVTQVIDREACDRIAAEFNSRKRTQSAHRVGPVDVNRESRE